MEDFGGAIEAHIAVGNCGCIVVVSATACAVGVGKNPGRRLRIIPPDVADIASRGVSNLANPSIDRVVGEREGFSVRKGESRDDSWGGRRGWPGTGRRAEDGESNGGGKRRRGARGPGEGRGVAE